MWNVWAGGEGYHQWRLLSSHGSEAEAEAACEAHNDSCDGGEYGIVRRGGLRPDYATYTTASEGEPLPCYCLCGDCVYDLTPADLAEAWEAYRRVCAERPDLAHKIVAPPAE